MGDSADLAGQTEFRLPNQPRHHHIAFVVPQPAKTLEATCHPAAIWAAVAPMLGTQPTDSGLVAPGPAACRGLLGDQSPGASHSPKSLLPQHTTSPSVVTPHVW